MINEFEKMWGKIAMAYVKVLSRHLPGRNDKPQSGESSVLARTQANLPTSAHKAVFCYHIAYFLLWGLLYDATSRHRVLWWVVTSVLEGYPQDKLSDSLSRSTLHHAVGTAYPLHMMGRGPP
jgi:hypothetical protein